MANIVSKVPSPFIISNDDFASVVTLFILVHLDICPLTRLMEII